jgi:uncharacterized phage protein (TIGR01671 family)
MREIKFRAWNPYQKIMQKPKSVYEMHWGSQCFDYLMQYTGLKDKNGKEIYESDFVRFGYHNEYVGQIKWSINNASFRVMVFGHEETMPYLHAQKCMEYYEVIGNIYENPELLEKFCI